MANEIVRAERLNRSLQMTPVAHSEGDPDNRLAFPVDRDVVWDTPHGERTADRGDVRIRENTPHRSGRQGMLFAPQSITEYRNTPERLKLAESIASLGVDHYADYVYPPDPYDYEEDDVPEDDSQLRKSIKNTIKNSRMPTELIRHLPRVEINYGDDSHFSGEEDENVGFYRHNDNLIAINHHYHYPGSHEFPRTLLHELGHAVDYSVNDIPSSRRRHTKMSVTDNAADPRMEGAAVGFTDRYGIDSTRDDVETSEDPTLPNSYHDYTNSDWGHNKGTAIFTNMRRHTRDTGAMPTVGKIDFLNEGKPHHMSEQFYQPTLWDN